MIDTNGGNTRQLAGAQCFRRDSVLGSAWSGTNSPRRCFAHDAQLFREGSADSVASYTLISLRE